MAAYESIFILRPDLDEEGVARICDKVGELINSHEGSLVNLEKVGHRRLAYEVEGFNEGFYVVLNFAGHSPTTRELERFYKINDSVIRYIIVRKEVDLKAEAGKRPAAKKARATEAQAEEAPTAEPPADHGPADEARTARQEGTEEVEREQEEPKEA